MCADCEPSAVAVYDNHTRSGKWTAWRDTCRRYCVSYVRVLTTVCCVDALREFAKHTAGEVVPVKVFSAADFSGTRADCQLTFRDILWIFVCACRRWCRVEGLCGCACITGSRRRQRCCEESDHSVSRCSMFPVSACVVASLVCFSDIEAEGLRLDELLWPFCDDAAASPYKQVRSQRVAMPMCSAYSVFACCRLFSSLQRIFRWLRAQPASAMARTRSGRAF